MKTNFYFFSKHGIFEKNRGFVLNSRLIFLKCYNKPHKPNPQFPTMRSMQRRTAVAELKKLISEPPTEIDIATFKKLFSMVNGDINATKILFLDARLTTVTVDSQAQIRVYREMNEHTQATVKTLSDCISFMRGFEKRTKYSSKIDGSVSQLDGGIEADHNGGADAEVSDNNNDIIPDEVSNKNDVNALELADSDDAARATCWWTVGDIHQSMTVKANLPTRRLIDGPQEIANTATEEDDDDHHHHHDVIEENLQNGTTGLEDEMREAGGIKMVHGEAETISASEATSIGDPQEIDNTATEEDDDQPHHPEVIEENVKNGTTGIDDGTGGIKIVNGKAGTITAAETTKIDDVKNTTATSATKAAAKTHITANGVASVTMSKAKVHGATKSTVNTAAPRPEKVPTKTKITKRVASATVSKIGHDISTEIRTGNRTAEATKVIETVNSAAKAVTQAPSKTKLTAKEFAETTASKAHQDILKEIGADEQDDPLSPVRTSALSSRSTSPQRRGASDKRSRSPSGDTAHEKARRSRSRFSEEHSARRKRPQSPQSYSRAYDRHKYDHSSYSTSSHYKRRRGSRY